MYSDDPPEYAGYAEYAEYAEYQNYPSQHLPTSVVHRDSNIPNDSSLISILPQQFSSQPVQHQTINIFNTIVENNVSTIPAQESQPDFAAVRDALESYYKRHLKIQLVSGKMLDLERCYVNLAIVEATFQQQIDNEESNGHSNEQSNLYVRMQSFENVVGAKLESTIQIGELFNKRRLCDGREDIPRKILVQGRAGIGKTTFCKKLVHQFINGEWRDRFDAVLWVPLRQLKIFKPQNIQDLIKAKFVSQLSDEEKSVLAKDLLTGVKLGRVLFILDGLDEILQDTQTDICLESFLNLLLQQTHIIITSRPSGVDYSILPALDLELETVGFSTNNIKDYVNNVLDEVAAESVMKFIHQTPVIQSIANIPVQLDVLCNSWESLPKNIEALTVTSLYRAMIDKLLRNDAIRLEKTDKGKPISIQLMNKLHERQVRVLMSTEMEYLSYLAYDGIKNNRIEFDYNKLSEIAEELDYFRVQSLRAQLPFDLLEILKQTSFLHTTKEITDSQKDLTRESFHFIHLTFQEYFAATWISMYFQTMASNATAISKYQYRNETISFIQKNKYNPRYEIIWWMIAGQLEGEALESYFQLLQAEPRDLIGVRHQFLIAGCYKEARSRLSAKLLRQIQSEMIQWLRFEMRFQENHNLEDGIGLKSVIPDDILIESMTGCKFSIKQVLKALANRRHLTHSTIERLTQMLSDKDIGIASLAAKSLGNQSTISDSTISAFITALQGPNPDIQQAAANALGRQSIMSESAISALITALQDQGSDVRRAAASALSGQSTMSNVTIAALITTALQDPNEYVRETAVIALGNQTTMLESTVTALITALEDRAPSVQCAAINSLGRQSAVSSSTVSALLKILRGRDSFVRRAAVKTLGYLSTISKYTSTALIGALQDRSPSVVFAVVNTLGNQSTMPESTMIALINALRYKDYDVREAATSVLGEQYAMSDTTIVALITALQDIDPKVQNAAAKILSKQSIMSDFAIEKLIAVLQNQNSEIREAATKALCNKSIISAPIIAALVTALQDQDPGVREAAVNALGSKSTIPESTVTALAIALQDQDPSVREAAANALSNMSTLSDSTISVLVTALNDFDPIVEAAANALGKQSTMTESTISALIKLLKNGEQGVRIAVIRALGNQSTMSESTITVLIKTIRNIYPRLDSEVRAAAAEALGNHHTMSGSEVLALIQALQDPYTLSSITMPILSALAPEPGNKNPELRCAAAIALGKLPTMPDYVVSELVTALQDRDSDVRTSAAKSLCNQSSMPNWTMPTLITALRDQTSGVRQAVASALFKQPTLSKSTVEALTDSLQHKLSYVRQGAAIGLGNQSSMSESTMAALVTILWDPIPEVRQAAANALGNQSTMSKSIIRLIVATTDLGPGSDFFYGVFSAPPLGLNTNISMYQNIKALYMNVLFKYSRGYYLSLFIHGNQLQIFTEKGCEESEELSAEDLQKIESTLMAIQKSNLSEK